MRQERRQLTKGVTSPTAARGTQSFWGILGILWGASPLPLHLRRVGEILKYQLSSPDNSLALPAN